MAAGLTNTIRMKARAQVVRHLAGLFLISIAGKSAVPFSVAIQIPLNLPIACVWELLETVKLRGDVEAAPSVLSGDFMLMQEPNGITWIFFDILIYNPAGVSK